MSEPKFHANLLLHLYLKSYSQTHSTLSCTVIFAYSKVNPLSFRAFLTPSIHILFGFLLPCLPSTPDSYTLFTILSSFIRLTCPNHLEAHLYALPDRSTFSYFIKILKKKKFKWYVKNLIQFIICFQFFRLICEGLRV